MRTLSLLLLVVLHAPAPSAPPRSLTGWRNGGAEAGYAMEAAGLATDAAGATVTLRAPAQPAGFGNASATIRADALRLERITLSGELQAGAVSDGASLWLRIDRARRC